MPSSSLSFPEEFLHYLWRLRLFDHTNLTTTEGIALRIVDQGTHNQQDAGPDFSQARIRLGDTLWAGHVELHKRSSDWLQHHHQNDPAYQTVVLHVVYEDDVPIYYPSGERLPTLVLRGRVSPRHLQRYAQLLASQQWIACKTQLSSYELQECQPWLHYLARERLAYKAAEVEQALEQNHYYWEETFYYFLARNFGVPQNAVAFEVLARSIPFKVMMQYKGDCLTLEALLLGQSGLLALVEAPDKYTQRLQKEYQFLAHKHGLQSLPASAWKRGKMRPAHLPTLRMAQLAALLHRSQHLFSRLLATQAPEELSALFKVGVTGYWDTHYRLSRPTQARKKMLGTNTIHSLLINTVAPFLVAYGRHKGDSSYGKRALALLNVLPAERNSTIDQWHDLGMRTANALETQALLQLKKHYCTAKRCLECQFGHRVLNRRDFGKPRSKIVPIKKGIPIPRIS